MKKRSDMAGSPVSPVILAILDGWGYSEKQDGNAISIARTPVFDSLWHAYPRTLIQASGKAVGLPEGQMGNSEVGHLNIGAGRVVPQELVRISDAVEDGSILENAALVNCCKSVKASGGKLHLVGLCSDGGVHSHIDHIVGLLVLAKQQGIEEVCIHAITDGRDTPPRSAIAYLEKLQQHCDEVGIGQIVTISGRYFAMDRDQRWERVQPAYKIMTEPGLGDGRSPREVMENCYAEDTTDEFVIPVRIAPGAIEANDGVMCFNFRPDRVRQICKAFVGEEFDGFERSLISPLSFVTFTQYDPTLSVAVAFEPESLNNILGEVIASHGLRQLRTAETEKYAHVTYFFNGGLEENFEGEDRRLVSSPPVSTYDHEPAMSANQVTKVVIDAIEQQCYSLIVVNYANPDMVGHTGKMEATIEAIETVDRCIGEVLSAASKAGGTVLVTADHGNAEKMDDGDGNPWTAHTTNLVPFVVIEGEKRKVPGHGADVSLRADGCLADIAPTILDILQLPQPLEMTGKSMIEPAKYQPKLNRTPVSVSL